MNKLEHFPDRKIDRARKWDQEIIKDKFDCHGENLVSMWIADMDFQGADEIQEALGNIAKNGTFGYTSTPPEFFTSVIDWHKRRRGISLQKEEIILTYGTVSTLHYLVQTFCKEGDGVVIHTPVYNPFSSCVTKQGCKVLQNTLEERENRYEMNFSLLEEQLKPETTKMMILCSPHNPSGRIWSKEELEQVATLCKKYDVILVVDEVHSEMIYYGEFTSAMALDDALFTHLILVTSPNKAFNFGGLKTSYAVVRNPELRRKFQRRLEQNSVTSPNIFGVTALITAYESCGYWLEDVCRYIKKNETLFYQWVDSVEELSAMKMESSYLPFLKVTGLGCTGDEFVQGLAKSKGVLLQSGTDFVGNAEGYVRINLGFQTHLLEEAIRRMDDYVKELLDKK